MVVIAAPLLGYTMLYITLAKKFKKKVNLDVKTFIPVNFGVESQIWCGTELGGGRGGSLLKLKISS